MPTLPYEHRIDHIDQLPVGLDEQDIGMWFEDDNTRYTWNGAVYVPSPRSDPEFAAREFAAKIGYDFGVLTDGTFLLEPPVDPNCCGICADRASKRV